MILTFKGVKSHIYGNRQERRHLPRPAAVVQQYENLTGIFSVALLVTTVTVVQEKRNYFATFCIAIDFI